MAIGNGAFWRTSKSLDIKDKARKLKKIGSDFLREYLFNHTGTNFLEEGRFIAAHKTNDPFEIAKVVQNEKEQKTLVSNVR